MPVERDNDSQSRFLVACNPRDYSASSLAHAVEDSNAHILSLNVRPGKLNDGRLAIELATNRASWGDTARSLSRYGYEVISAESPSLTDDGRRDTLRLRANEILHILEL